MKIYIFVVVPLDFLILAIFEYIFGHNFSHESPNVKILDATDSYESPLSY